MNRFQTAGHDAISILDQRLGGGTDDSISDICRKEDRALVTLDLDFADIRAYPPQDYPGLIVLRLGRQDKLQVLEVIERMLPNIEVEQLSGRLWIVENETIRVRGQDVP